MTQVRALTQIQRNPTGRMISTDRFDEAGNLILKADGDIHLAGSTFDIEDPVELQSYLECNAVVVVEAMTAIEELEARIAAQRNPHAQKYDAIIVPREEGL